jgi:hypothetical protein
MASWSATRFVGNPCFFDRAKISLDHGVSTAALEGLAGVQRSVNPAIDHPRAALARHASDLISTQSIAGMDTDADNIARLYLLGIQRFQRLIDQYGIAKTSRRGCRQNVQPAWSNYGCAERNFTGIDEVNAHAMSPSLGGLAKAVEQLAPGTTISGCLERCKPGS